MTTTRKRRKDRWDRKAERIVTLWNWECEDTLDHQLRIARALRRVYKAASKRGYESGFKMGMDKGYAHGSEDQMKMRIMDAKERSRR